MPQANFTGQPPQNQGKPATSTTSSNVPGGAAEELAFIHYGGEDHVVLPDRAGTCLHFTHGNLFWPDGDEPDGEEPNVTSVTRILSQLAYWVPRVQPSSMAVDRELPYATVEEYALITSTIRSVYPSMPLYVYQFQLGPTPFDWDLVDPYFDGIWGPIHWNGEASDPAQINSWIDFNIGKAQNTWGSGWADHLIVASIPWADGPPIANRELVNLYNDLNLGKAKGARLFGFFSPQDPTVEHTAVTIADVALKVARGEAL